MKLFYIIIICLISSLSEGRSGGGRETSSCIADYLKSKGLIESNLGSDRPLNPLCTTVVQVTKSHIMDSVKLEVMSDKNMKKEVDCVIENLSKTDFSNNLLVVYVYETSDNIVDREKKIQEAQSKVTRATFDAFLRCKSEKNFGLYFDDLLEVDSSAVEEEEASHKEDYCIRKYIIEKRLIDLEIYNLKMNPKNLDTTKINCTYLTPKYIKDFEDDLVRTLLDDSSEDSAEEPKELNPIEVACLWNAIRKGKYVDEMIPYNYLKEFNLGSETKRNLRSKFVAFMRNLSDSLTKCTL
ncbi:CLUMA_CG014110, isoform A [Clunio marinus]|uniref:CLUMA_CG014110, isoform A n=1 Tax=Clunio marinus TaxID=568069 RepID=A0A1J1IKW1_9DIPT|nr:CLUMA_CG014110, isoform A [Clunio marinus]